MVLKAIQSLGKG